MNRSILRYLALERYKTVPVVQKFDVVQSNGFFYFFLGVGNSRSGAAAPELQLRSWNSPSLYSGDGIPHPY